MDATTASVSPATRRYSVLGALGLTLVCPGLAQIRMGARTRGFAILAAVTATLVWMVLAYLGPVHAYVTEKVSVMAQFPDPATMARWANDPELWNRFSPWPGIAFLVAFIYAFIDAVWLARR